jgi:hypothetical protein
MDHEVEAAVARDGGLVTVEHGYVDPVFTAHRADGTTIGHGAAVELAAGVHEVWVMPGTTRLTVVEQPEEGA